MKYIVTILLLGPFLLNSQETNLVVNGGFESESSPIISTWLKENPIGTKLVEGWITPTLATPDYYNSDESVCDGFPVAMARTGTGRGAVICGMETQLPGVNNYKEYLSGRLKTPLVAGQEYTVSFYATLDCSSAITSTGIGAYFSASPMMVNNKERLPVTPQVRSNHKLLYQDGWTLISGKFKAKGGESYITIGSFSDTAYLRAKPVTIVSSPHVSNHAYVYIDDVCVAPSSSQVCLCKNETEITSSSSSTQNYFFLLDASNSMNESGKLKLMKEEILKFADSISDDDRVAIMIFNEQPSILLPFTSAKEDDVIKKKISRIKAKSTTNGDLAIKKMKEYLDSLQLPGNTHVIMATDGVFRVSMKTKSEADTFMVRNKVSFCVLQFGTTKNEDLEDMTKTVEEGLYTFADENNLNQILNNQITRDPEVPKEIAETVYYTKIDSHIDPMLLSLMMGMNPGDQFMKIPRKRGE